MLLIKNFLSFFYLILIIFIIFSCISNFALSNYIQNNSETIEEQNYYFSTSEFFWPLPGFHTITSPFGKRISPTTGASSNHSGIDISAPEGSTIYSITNGSISFIGFNGANGCTIKVQSNNLEISYCHVSPNYIVNYGDIVYSGEKIANIGPKNIYEIPNNPYKDKNGNPTNGATTGCHLHLGIKKDGIAVNPLDFFK